MKSIIRISLGGLLVLSAFQASATTYFYEPFSYAAGTTITNSPTPGYIQNSGTAGQLDVAATGLSYTLSGYPAGVGNSLNMTTSASEDAFTTFTGGIPTTATLQNVYMSFQANFSAIPAVSGTYFTALLPSNSTGNYTARIFAQQITATTFKFGIQMGSSGVVFESGTRNLSTTYLVVVKYEMKPGAQDDIGSIFINPASTTVEPAIPDATHTAVNPDSPDIARFAVRQASGIGTFQIDEVRVAATYAESLGQSVPANVADWSMY